MSGPRRDLGMADMRDMPMSLGWMRYLEYQRSTLRNLMLQHQVTMKACKCRDLAAMEQDEVAQRLSLACLEQVDRYIQTMAAADVQRMEPDA